MRIVAIDSSGLVASVAILENDSILATYSVNFNKSGVHFIRYLL